MKETIQRLIDEADSASNRGDDMAAAQAYEKAAEESPDPAMAAAHFRKAAEFYRQVGMYAEADGCYREGADRLAGEEKAACLLECWKTWIQAIVHLEYDCGFEWRGETDGTHDSLGELSSRYRKKAEHVLRQAAGIPGIDRDRIVQQACEECLKRQREGGWGASTCREMVRRVSGP